MKLRTMIAALAALALVGCEAPIARESGGAPGRTVDLIAVTPDGTKLWRVYTLPTGFVYFASSGTNWNSDCGKNCTENMQVPTADPLEAVGQ
jgi:streptogramin lyase